MSSFSLSSSSPMMQQQPKHSIILQPNNNASSPWSVDVCSALPLQIVRQSQSLRSRYVTAAVTDRWYCLCLRRQNNTTTTTNSATTTSAPPPPPLSYYELALWYAPVSASLADLKHKTPVLTLQHELLSQQDNINQDDDDSPPLLAAAVSSATTTSNSDVVYIYVAIRNVLVLWKISRKDVLLQQQQQQKSNTNNNRIIQPAAIVTLPADNNNEEHIITALTVEWNNNTAWPTILVGCGSGRLYWVTQSHVPVSLAVEHVEASVSGGVFSRLWSAVQYHEANVPVAALLSYFDSSKSSFISISETGRLVVWNVTPTDGARCIFQVAADVGLVELLREEQDVFGEIGMQSLQVLKAAVSSSDCYLHVICLTHHVGEDARLYWVRLQLLPTQDSATATKIQSLVWLNRFVAPESVEITGLVLTNDGMAYAAFSQGASSSLSCILMAMEAHNEQQQHVMIHEVDLPMPPVQNLLENTCDKDIETHGITVLDESGLGLRARLVLASTTTSSTTTVGRTTAAVPNLTNHLTSVFWESYTHPENYATNKRLPPSLTTASISDLEATVLNTARQLQNKGDRGAKQNPLEWHLGLIRFLQQTGLYRQLSIQSKWSLLTIGQEVNAFWTLGTSIHANSPWETEQLGQLSSAANVGDWLLRVQESALADGSGENRQSLWCDWLCMVLESAMTFREERASAVYDVSPNQPPLAASTTSVPLWTSTPALQTVLATQLEFWLQTDGGALAVGSSTSDSVETVTQYALQSFSDSFVSCPGAEAKAAYTKAQRQCFAVVRKVRGLDGDSFLFELSRAHRYFGGLCQIAFDHEKRSDRESFDLVALFTELEMQEDVETGMKFTVFVLKWFTDRELFGQVLTYGKLCPESLGQLMRNVEALAPFRWIHAVRQGDYNGATDSLYENAQKADCMLPAAKVSLSMASISNSIVEQESMTLKETASKRRRLIHKKTELINAQEALFGEDSRNISLRTPKDLLNKAIRKFEGLDERDDKVAIFVVALAICTTFEEEIDVQEAALLIWFKSIVTDQGLWENWLANETDLMSPTLREMVLQSTVFGGLLQQCRETDDWKDIMYGPVIEAAVFEKLRELHPFLLTAGMQRLLRSVAGGEDSESMMIAASE